MNKTLLLTGDQVSDLCICARFCASRTKDRKIRELASSRLRLTFGKCKRNWAIVFAVFDLRLLTVVRCTFADFDTWLSFAVSECEDSGEDTRETENDDEDDGDDEAGEDENGESNYECDAETGAESDDDADRIEYLPDEDSGDDDDRSERCECAGDDCLWQDGGDDHSEVAESLDGDVDDDVVYYFAALVEQEESSGDDDNDGDNDDDNGA